jgi:hypothetical protein
MTRKALTLTVLLAGLLHSVMAAAQAMYITPDGDVGVGTDAPLAPFEVTRGDGTARILVSDTVGTQGARTLFEILNNGNPEFRLTNTGNGNSWVFSAGRRFVVKNNAGDPVMRVTDTGDLELLGTVLPLSDVNAKTDIVAVNPETVLDKVVQLPITEWAYKANPDSRHIGPMAQDFRAAFGTGTDEKRLATMDVSGVALASIQALNQKLERRNQALEQKNLELEERLELLEATITNLLQRSAQN